MRSVAVVAAWIVGGTAVCFAYDLYGAWWAGVVYIGGACVAMWWAMLCAKREERPQDEEGS